MEEGGKEKKKKKKKKKKPFKKGLFRESKPDLDEEGRKRN